MKPLCKRVCHIQTMYPLCSWIHTTAEIAIISRLPAVSMTTGRVSPITCAQTRFLPPYVLPDQRMPARGDQTFPDQRNSGFCFEGMSWEGKATDATLVSTPSMWGGALSISLGEDWGRNLAPDAFKGVFARWALPLGSTPFCNMRAPRPPGSSCKHRHPVSSVQSTHATSKLLQNHWPPPSAAGI